MIQEFQDKQLPNYYLRMSRTCTCPQDRKFFEKGYNRMTGKEATQYPVQLKEARELVKNLRNEYSAKELQEMTGIPINTIEKLLNRFRPTSGMVKNAKEITRKLKKI